MSPAVSTGDRDQVTTLYRPQNSAGQIQLVWRQFDGLEITVLLSKTCQIELVMQLSIWTE